MSNLDEYQQKLQAQLAEWKTQADALKVKAEGASAELKADIDAQLEKLKGLQAEAQGKFEELRSAGGEKLNELKATVEGLASEAAASLKSLTSRFK